MNQQRISTIARLIGDTMLIVFFVQGILYPLQNAYWIFVTGVNLYALELLSVASAVAIATYHQKRQYSFSSTALLIFIFAIPALFLSFKTAEVIPIGFFLISTLTKIKKPSAEGTERSRSATKTAGIQAIIFLVSIYIASLPFWKDLLALPLSPYAFPVFPHQSYTYPLGSDINQHPEILLVWGVLYFSITLTKNIWEVKKGSE